MYVFRPENSSWQVPFIFFCGGRPTSLTFSIQGGSTCIISNPSKFLGQIVGASSQATKKLSAKMLSSMLDKSLINIDDCPIHGDFKVWVYRNFLVPSLFFHLSVNLFNASAINKMQAKATRFLKKWLHLPRCATLSILFNPDVLHLPYLPHLIEKAKLKCLTSITSSLDPLTDIVQQSLCIPHSCVSLFSAVVRSVQEESPTRSKTIKSKCESTLSKSESTHWNGKLDDLIVNSRT